MKKYVVVKNSCLIPSVVFQSDSKENATKWAEIMSDEKPDDEYVIYEQVMEE